MRTRTALFALLALTGLPCAAADAQPRAVPDSPRYFVMLFGADAGQCRPTRAHTWATYIKATPAGDGTWHVEQLTISWLPADGTIDGTRPFRAEPGANLTLRQSLDYAASRNSDVAAWGPFETDALRYFLAARQVGRLQAGVIAYRAVDSFARKPNVDHCVHAVTGAEPTLADRRQPPGRIGREGTAELVQQYIRAGAFDPTVRHDWLLPALGLRACGPARKRVGWQPAACH